MHENARSRLVTALFGGDPMTRNIIFTFIFVLTFALTPFSRATAQDASVGGGAGGGIITADLKNIFLQSKQLAEAYKQYQQLLSIQGQQKLIYETLGLSGEDMEFLTEVGNLINTACNTKIPGFSYWFNFNLPLPPLPRDPCSLALAYLPYDTNYYTDFMNQTTGAATNVLNDPTKLNTELKSYPNSLKIVRDWFYINPNAHEGGIPPELEIEKRQNRQKAAALDAQSAYAQAATMQARSGDTVAELNREIKTPTQDMRGDIKQLLLQQYQTNLLLSDMLNQMAVQTRLHATEKIVDSSVIDPRGCGGRADSDPQTGGKAC